MCNERFQALEPCAYVHTMKMCGCAQTKCATEKCACDRRVCVQLLDEKQRGELASLELPDHSPEFGRRMSWLWAAIRAFETIDPNHRLRRALLPGFERVHTPRGL